MRKLLIGAVAGLVAVAAYGREPERGYRGFVEWDNLIGNTSYFSSADGVVKPNETQWFIGVSTSHGYQLNNNLFVGAGLMAAAATPSGDINLPIFAEARYDVAFDKFTPFGDVRLGYNFGDGGGIYFSPTVGYRFNWGRKADVNLGLGLTVRGKTEDIFAINADQWCGTSVEIVKDHQTNAFFTFRIGIGF